MSLSSRCQESKVKVSAGPLFLPRLQGRMLPASSSLWGLQGLWSSLGLWPRPPSLPQSPHDLLPSSSQTPLCLSHKGLGPISIIQDDLKILTYICKDPFSK